MITWVHPKTLFNSGRINAFFKSLLDNRVAILMPVSSKLSKFDLIQSLIHLNIFYLTNKSNILAERQLIGTFPIIVII